MSRYPRISSDTGIYHAILRGVNKQQIFECDEDNEQFVRILMRQCGQIVDLRPAEDRPNELLLRQLSGEDEPEVETPERHCYIYAWCLIGNHVHLLNFLTLLRYIHQNPLKPQLVKDLKDYPWSSWQEYLGMSTRPFCSTAAVFKRISLKDLTDIVTKPMTENEEEGILEYEPKGKKSDFTDADVWRMIEAYSGARNLSEFQKFDRPYQKNIMYTIHEYGVGPRQISRLTGVTYSVVQKLTEVKGTGPVGHRYPNQQFVRETDSEEEEYLSYLDSGEFERYPEY